MTEATKPRSALVELTLARFRLFIREPSAVFWTFGFPVILSAALGIAFRNRPASSIHAGTSKAPMAVFRRFSVFQSTADVGLSAGNCRALRPA